MVFYKDVWWWPQIYNESKEYDMNRKSKLVKVMKLTSKSNVVIFFWALYLHDKFWRP